MDDFKTLMDRMETDLAALKHEYDLFFLGRRRGEPMKERKELESRLLALSRRSVVNNSDQLRFTNLQGRYWAFANLWTRTLRDMEEGRIRRDAVGAIARSGGERKGPVDPEQLDRAAEALLEARRSCGLAVDPSELPALRETLLARAAEISAASGGKKVVFRVSVEEGKPKVKATLC